MKHFRAFNTWYDNMEEPYRFFFFLFLVAIPFIMFVNNPDTSIATVLKPYMVVVGVWVFYRVYRISWK